MHQLNDLQKAKQILLNNNYTCVLACGDVIFTTNKRGVAPLMNWHNSNSNYSGFSAADKVVGKAAAFLYVLLGVESVYATVISKPAYDVLISNKISVSYDQMVEAISNRTNTGCCPMESAVINITNPKDAPQIIKDTINKLNNN